MPNPTRSEVHVNRPLSSIAVATIQDQKNFIHDKVFPVVGVVKQSDKYFRFDRSYWMRPGAEKRAPATESLGSGFSVDSSPQYFCDVWAYHQDLDDYTFQNCDEPIDLHKASVEFLTQKMMLRREKLFIQTYMAPGVWGGLLTTNGNGVRVPTDYTPSISWSSDNSNPIADIAKMKTEITRQTSITPNTMVVSHDVNERLKQHPMVLNRILYSQLGIATEDLLAQFFGVDKYLVAKAVENTAQEGQVGQYNFMQDNKILLTYAAPNPGIMIETGGYIFSWTGMYGASAMGSRIKKFRLEHLSAERIEMEMAFDMAQVSPELGILGTNMLTP